MKTRAPRTLSEPGKLSDAKEEIKEGLKKLTGFSEKDEPAELKASLEKCKSERD